MLCKYKCALKLDINQEIECCDAPEINPDIYEYKSSRYINYTHQIECGFKCCQRVYTVKCYWDSLYERWFTNLKPTFTKETYPGSNCSEVSTFIDCLTNQPIPCQGNCD